MWCVLAIATFTFASCARLERNSSEMTPEQMLQRASHVFIGVIEKHEFPNRFLFRVTGEQAEGWFVVRMKVRVETTLRGTGSRPEMDIYEAFPGGGLAGDWNLTQNGRRYLFLVRLESGPLSACQGFPAKYLSGVQWT
jgi:hypothetical protein